MSDTTNPTNPTNPDKPDNPDQPNEDVSSGIDTLDWLVVQLKSMILTLWDMLSDFLILIVDLFMDLGIAFLDGMSDLLKVVDLSSYINDMPSEVQTVLALTGFGSAISMVMAAAAARLLMQLVPFVRLGS